MRARPTAIIGTRHPARRVLHNLLRERRAIEVRGAVPSCRSSSRESPGTSGFFHRSRRKASAGISSAYEKLGLLGSIRFRCRV